MSTDSRHAPAAHAPIVDPGPGLWQVLDHLFAFVGILEPDGTLLRANTAPLAAAAIGAQDVIGRKLWDCHWCNYCQAVRSRIRDACHRAAQGVTQRFDISVRMAGQSLMDIDLQIAPMRDANGRITHLIPSAVDITRRKQQEEALRQRAEEVEKLMDLVPAAVFLARDVECLDMIGNRMATEFYEAAPGENLSAGVSRQRVFLRDGKELPPEALPMQVAAATGREVRQQEIDVRLPSGRTLTVWGGAVPLRDSKGEVRGCVGAFTDITCRREAEQAIVQADRAKSDFIALLGHELRNPLAPLTVGLDLLDQAEQIPDVLEKVRPMMRRQLSHLLRLADDLLDISRITRDRIEIRRERIDLRAAIASAVEQSAALIHERHHELVERCTEAALPVRGDLDRLTQVVANILSNAAKYTPMGGMVILAAQAEDGEAVLRIRDTGYGIPPAQLDRVFDQFVQIAEHQEQTGIGGLGLGLALARKLIEMHGGSIEARSDGIGRGSEFVVRLPLALE